LQHFSLVASRADGNGMGPQDLASAFALHVFGKGEVLRGSVHVRKLAGVRFIFTLSSLIFSRYHPSWRRSLGIRKPRRQHIFR
jgi:hypothetical protein